MIHVGLQFIAGKPGNGDDETIFTVSKIEGKFITLTFDENRSTTYLLSDAQSNLETKRWTIIQSKDPLINFQLVDKTAMINELYHIHIMGLGVNYAGLDKKVKSEIKTIGRKLTELLETFRAL